MRPWGWFLLPRGAEPPWLPCAEAPRQAAGPLGPAPGGSGSIWMLPPTKSGRLSSESRVVRPWLLPRGAETPWLPCAEAPRQAAGPRATGLQGSKPGERASTPKDPAWPAALVERWRQRSSAAAACAWAACMCTCTCACADVRPPPAPPPPALGLWLYTPGLYGGPPPPPGPGGKISGGSGSTVGPGAAATAPAPHPPQPGTGPQAPKAGRPSLLRGDHGTPAPTRPEWDPCLPHGATGEPGTPPVGPLNLRTHGGRGRGHGGWVGMAGSGRRGGGPGRAGAR